MLNNDVGKIYLITWDKGSSELCTTKKCLQTCYIPEEGKKIIKFGRTSRIDNSRKHSYRLRRTNGELIFERKIADHKKYEQFILGCLKEKYKQLRIFGNEYFEAKEDEILEYVINLSLKDISDLQILNFNISKPENIYPPKINEFINSMEMITTSKLNSVKNIAFCFLSWNDIHINNCVRKDTNNKIKFLKELKQKTQIDTSFTNLKVDKDIPDKEKEKFIDDYKEIFNKNEHIDMLKSTERYFIQKLMVKMYRCIFGTEFIKKERANNHVESIDVVNGKKIRRHIKCNNGNKLRKMFWSINIKEYELYQNKYQEIFTQEQ
jgi:hypothetical protein